MSEPWGDPSCGISSGDVLIRPGRHPACRRREAQPGSCTERENLTGDGKGKGASGSNREAESTDAPERGGRLRSSDEAGVIPSPNDHDLCAHWRFPIDMIIQGRSTSLFQASQQWAGRSSWVWNTGLDARV